MKTIFLSSVSISVLVFSLLAQVSRIQTEVLPRGYFVVGSDGKLRRPTAAESSALTAAMWSGIWKEDTNGIRVGLYSETTYGQPWVRVGVGSTVFNAPTGYVWGSIPRFAKFELRDSNDVVIPPSKGGAMEAVFPVKIRAKSLPRWPDGGLKNNISFLTNGGPYPLTNINLNNVYIVTTEGDYKLTVCPTIYKFESNRQYLDRIELPSVTSQVHLFPNKGH